MKDLRVKFYMVGTIICALAVSLTSCSTDPEQVSGELPMVDISGSSHCGEEYTIDGPNFDAWRVSGTAVIAGTIDRVEVVHNPVVMSQRAGDGSISYVYGEREDCTEDSLGIPVADIYLTNVETFYGEEQGDEVVIRASGNELSTWQVFAEENDRGEVEWYDNSGRTNFEVQPGLFASGMRIGGSIRQSTITDLVTFQFRLFQVIDGVVQLQEFSPELEAEIEKRSSCALTPFPTTMLVEREQYDGMRLDEFAAALRNDSVDLDVLRQDYDQLDNYRRHYFDEVEDEGIRSFRGYFTTCVSNESGEPPVDSDADPDA